MPRVETARIAVGNVFGHGFDAASVASLERLGFAIRPGTSHFAGAQAMRFIDFPRGPSLEFIQVTDADAYAAYVPEGMVPYSPGINLLLRGGTEGALATFAEAFREFRPYRLHVNYDGTSGANQPGWNYLNFGVPLLQKTFVWLTTLDEPHPSATKITAHRNGTVEVRGLWFNLEADALELLGRLVGGEVRDGTLAVGGIEFWSKDSGLDVPAIHGKRFPLALIVLEANEVRQPEPPTEGAETAQFDVRPAVHMRTNPRSWDLVVVERRHGPSRRPGHS